MLQDRERLAREAVREIKQKKPWLFSEEQSQQFYRAHIEMADIEMLVVLAYDGNKDAMDIVQAYTQGAREAGTSIPRAVEEYALDYLAFGPPKRKRGPDPKDTGLKYLTIALLVNTVHRDYGFPEYRNSDHRGEKTGPMSACLLVAEELKLSERTVEDIWRDRKEWVLRLQAEARLIPQLH
jgi:hypothetical protein